MQHFTRCFRFSKSFMTSKHHWGSQWKFSFVSWCNALLGNGFDCKSWVHRTSEYQTNHECGLIHMKSSTNWQASQSSAGVSTSEAKTPAKAFFSILLQRKNVPQNKVPQQLSFKMLHALAVWTLMNLKLRSRSARNIKRHATYQNETRRSENLKKGFSVCLWILDDTRRDSYVNIMSSRLQYFRSRSSFLMNLMSHYVFEFRLVKAHN